MCIRDSFFAMHRDYRGVKQRWVVMALCGACAVMLGLVVLLPKLVASFLPAEGTSPTLPRKQRQREKQQLEQQRYLAMLATVIVVLAGLGYLLFASQQGSNGFHKVYPYVSMWSQSQS